MWSYLTKCHPSHSDVHEPDLEVAPQIPVRTTSLTQSKTEEIQNTKSSNPSAEQKSPLFDDVVGKVRSFWGLNDTKEQAPSRSTTSDPLINIIKDVMKTDSRQLEELRQLLPLITEPYQGDPIGTLLDTVRSLGLICRKLRSVCLILVSACNGLTAKEKDKLHDAICDRSTITTSEAVQEIKMVIMFHQALKSFMGPMCGSTLDRVFKVREAPIMKGPKHMC